MTLPSFRPRSATEIVDAAIQLGRQHYAPLVTLGALVAIPGVAIGLVALWLMPQPDAAAADLPGAVGDMGLALLATLVSVCWLFVGFGALLASAAAAYVNGRPLEPMDALRQALRRAGTLIAGHLLAMAAIFLVVFIGLMLVGVAAGLAAGLAGVLAGGVPGPTATAVGVAVLVATMIGMVVGGLFAYARFVNVTAAIMLEGAGPVESLRRSNQLVRGHTPRTAGVVGMLWVLYIVAYGSLWALAALVVRRVEISSNVASVLVIAVYPFIASLLALLYYDLRIRREGYDLELMARALEGAPPEAPV